MAFEAYHPESPKDFVEYAAACIRATRDSFGVDLHYDLESVRKLDDIIDDLLAAIGKPKNLPHMIMIFGAFLGETFRQVYNGRWEWNEQYKSWAVKFQKAKGGEEGAFVFAKMEKRFVNGAEDSISFFTKVIDAKVKGTID